MGVSVSFVHVLLCSVFEKDLYRPQVMEGSLIVSVFLYVVPKNVFQYREFFCIFLVAVKVEPKHKDKSAVFSFKKICLCMCVGVCMCV